MLFLVLAEFNRFMEETLMVSKQRRAEIVTQFGGNAKNSGTMAVQIALLTEDIENLKPHFANNPKDLHSKRGFIAKIERRKKYLNYLKSTDYEAYATLIKQLKLRK